MIKQLDEKNYLDKLKKEQLFKFEDLYYIAEEIIKLKGLENYVDKIVAGSEPAYYTKDKKVSLNTNINSYWVSCFEDELCFKRKAPVNYYNLLLLYSLMHELRHAEQKKIIVEDYEKYGKYFLRNMIMGTVRNYYYPDDHDKLYTEYDAFVNPMFELNKLDMDELMILNRNIAYRIYYAYLDYDNKTIKCPIEISEEVTSHLWKRLYSESQMAGESKNSMYFKAYDAYEYANMCKREKSNKIEDKLKIGDVVDNINIVDDIYKGKIRTKNIINELKRR